jgi:LacI family transcriptional regulator
VVAKKTVTIRDVARQADVSPGTASRAINRSPLVNQETRQRVLEIAKQLDYHPSVVARRLSIGKTLAIAVIVPFFTRPSVLERLSGAVSALSQSQYDLVIRDIETPEQRYAGFGDILRQDRVDGALLISLPILDNEIPQLVNADVPIVLIDTNHPALTSLHSLIGDDLTGGEAATQHLIGLGHRRIGFVGDFVENPFYFASSRDRYYGYLRALQAAGIPFYPEYYREHQHGRYEARQQAKTILSLADRPTAIFAASDHQAVGVLEAAREVGLRVPEDLSVIGYHDLEIADVLNLTTMRQMLFESGQRGVELLLQALDNAHMEPVHEVLPVELVIRHTTGPPP